MSKNNTDIIVYCGYLEGHYRGAVHRDLTSARKALQCISYKLHGRDDDAILTLGDLLKIDLFELMETPGVGKKSLQIIREFIKKHTEEDNK